MWELDCEESWSPKNWCFWTVVLEKTLESPLDYKEIQPVHPKGDQSWVFIGRTDAEAETAILWPPHWKRPWCWEGLVAGREGDNRGWNGWIASPTQWAWVWANSRSWWWTGRPGVLWFMGSQRVGHDRANELNWTELMASQVALVVKNLHANAGDIRDLSSIPGSGRFPSWEHSNPLQCCCLENPMHGGAWQAAVHAVSRSQTPLKQFSTLTYCNTNIFWSICIILYILIFITAYIETRLADYIPS